MLGVAHVLGSLLAIFGATFALPLVCSLIARDGQAFTFLIAAGISAGGGLLISFATRDHSRELKPRDGFLLATLSWVLMSAAASIPLLLAIPGLSFTNAYFEAMSGLTTTGATILTGLDSLPPSINLWRHALHWFGGLGIIVLAVAVLPLLGVGGMQLYKAEAPGPVKDEKLTPRITETAKSLWVVYTFLTVLGILALRLCGMSWLDAVCHTFSAMGLGGFSTHDASIGYFNSVSIELVLMVLMVLASLNFARHFVALRRLSVRTYLQDPEAKAIALVLTVSVLGITVLLTIDGTYPTFFTSLRHAAFNVISLATTSGFLTQDFGQWPVFAPVWMLFLTSVTCSTGSTGGGIKMFRTLLLARQAGRELKLLVHPNAVWPVRIGGRPIPDAIGDSVLAFIFLYFMTVVVLTFALLLTGLNFDSSFAAIISSVNSTGPALAGLGPIHHYYELTDVQTWICTIAMLVGRLEVFSVLVLFTAAFWRK
ncbi:MAG TPA: potassium transporter TrkG [Steroidobacteraceae bacterium]|nr:potassium transporter TrkG [Steroidobacteraceae bacterium]